MEFTAEHDIKAPIEFVYDQVTDFAALETYIMSAGAFVERTDETEGVNPGMSWRIDGTVRGRHRIIDIELVDLAVQEQLGYEIKSKDMTTQMTIELVPLDRTLTRIVSRVAPEAHSISARLILQSARLAQRTLEKRLKKRLSNYGAQIEERYINA